MRSSRSRARSAKTPAGALLASALIHAAGLAIAWLTQVPLGEPRLGAAESLVDSEVTLAWTNSEPESAAGWAAPDEASPLLVLAEEGVSPESLEPAEITIVDPPDEPLEMPAPSVADAQPAEVDVVLPAAAPMRLDGRIVAGVGGSPRTGRPSGPGTEPEMASVASRAGTGLLGIFNGAFASFGVPGGEGAGPRVGSPATSASVAPGNPPPRYPADARRLGWEGRVRLRVRVAVDGSCAGVRVEESSGHDLLDEAAMTAVRGWKFKPATRASAPIESELLVPIRFTFSG